MFIIFENIHVKGILILKYKYLILRIRPVALEKAENIVKVTRRGNICVESSV